MRKPLVIELFAGRFGWGKGFVSEGWRCIGFDIVHEEWHRPVPLGCELVLQDVLTLHGSQFREADAIVASPPCQGYSYRAMPWKRAKALPPPSNELFDACFRIQHEASEAKGEYIPMVVENVKGAQPWVGRAKWHFGPFYLFGDVPALMPIITHTKNSGGSWFGQRDGKPLERNDPRDMRRNEDGEYVVMGIAGGHNHPGKALDGRKNEGGSWFAVAHNVESGHSRNPVNDAVKGTGGSWFTPDEGSREEVGHWKKSGCVTRQFNSKSNARKAASAAIAEIPLELASHIARVFYPR